ncbi:tripartite motif protein, putative [Plasmodium ovale curtisi]|uniref:Tripartite motif protein, putative n=1 Tax=Plasmodium ovale curtisi TaxID=864141 RepID=A0A1A8WNV3_PLAOA|nr:tripartite motif protein, putative [Plasmodium ovale curtisi]SBT00984.1 tripartite motif protein, putative [Plasmodium ovale curtisi]
MEGKKVENGETGECFADSDMLIEKTNTYKVILDIIDSLTKVGIFSSKVLNFHTFCIKLCSNNDKTRDRKEEINDKSLKIMSTKFSK